MISLSALNGFAMLRFPLFSLHRCFFCFEIAFLVTFSISSLAGDYSIVALGNSLTVHGPSKRLGWDGNWGMAATAEQNDYMSILQQRMSVEMSVSGRVSIKRLSLYQLEKGGEVDDAILYKNLREANLVVVELGDNVEKGEISQLGFKKNYSQLLRRVRDVADSAVVVCLGTWWENPQVDVVVRNACADIGKFIPLHDLSLDPLNLAVNERPDLAPGVGMHPGDRGMRMIADRIFSYFK